MTPSVANAQSSCSPSWIPTFGEQPGVDGPVNAMTVFDDGTGSALYVGGSFIHGGGNLTPKVGKWDGSTWSSTNTVALGGAVYALTVFDDGTGPALYAGGSFGVAKRTGTGWSYLGSFSGTVYALAVFDDGQGARLCAGGQFGFVLPNAPNIHADNILKWNGSAWTELGFGLNQRVRALAVFDDGAGEALYAGGDFITSGTTQISHIAKWDGSGWTALGSGTNDKVDALAVWDAGNGPALFAGGLFTSAGGFAALHVAKWDVAGWSALAGGPNGEVFALTTFNDGTGRALYAGGQLVTGGAPLSSTVTKWNGSSWSAVSGAPDYSASGTAVRALTTFNDGGGKQLFVAGDYFPSAGGIGARNIAKWSGTSWSGLGAGVSNPVQALTVFDDGTGPLLYAGGYFLSIGGVAMNGVAKWNGSRWSALGNGAVPNCSALAVFDDGNGSALYAAGNSATSGGVFTWNGSTWSPVGGAYVPGGPRALTVFDDGTGAALYAGGYFTSAGGVSAKSIARWDGVTWSALGTGLGGTNFLANSLAVFDDGSGSALYAGGMFATAGGVAAENIARWDGTNWSGMGSAMTGFAPYAAYPWVQCMTQFDDGTGPALFVGGYFHTVGGVTVNSIAKWNGVNWSSLDSGLEDANLGFPVAGALATFDDGSGLALYVMGSFTKAGAIAANSIAKWNGHTWSPLGGGGVGGSPAAFATFDDSSGPALYAGGTFFGTIDSHDSFLAKWGCPFTASGVSYCTTTTTSNGCVPTISANGSASASSGAGFTVSISNLESHRLGLVFYGIHGQLAAPWGVGGSSLLCVKAPTQRMHAYNSGGTTGLCNGLISEDWNLFIATHASALGQPFAGGETVWAQGWYRDPPTAKTTGLSNGLVFAVAP